MILIHFENRTMYHGSAFRSHQSCTNCPSSTRKRTTIIDQMLKRTSCKHVLEMGLIDFGLDTFDCGENPHSLLQRLQMVW